MNKRSVAVVSLSLLLCMQARAEAKSLASTNAKDSPRQAYSMEKAKEVEEAIIYRLPVRLMNMDPHATNPVSMANTALVQEARVEERDGQYKYFLSFMPMKVGTITGNVNDFSLYINGEKQRGQREGQGTWSFVLSDPIAEIECSIHVKEMDFEPHARLVFDWDKYEESSNKEEKREKTEIKDWKNLEKELKISGKIEQEGHSYESYERFYRAYNWAADVYREDQPSQSKIDKATNGLKEARMGLKKVSKEDDKNESKKPWSKGDLKSIYQVPVRLLKSDGGLSMANGALKSKARVMETKEGFEYCVYFMPLEKDFAGKTMQGNVTNLLIKDRQAFTIGGGFSFSYGEKAYQIPCTIWVDIMDQISGGGQGSGAQKALLDFDWSQAKKIESTMEDKKDGTKEKLTLEMNRRHDTNQLRDITKHWGRKAIEYTVEKGYFKGTSQTSFQPDREISRGEFITGLGRLAKIDKEKFSPSNFKDVSHGKYYSPYINWAAKENIVKGDQSYFSPEDSLKREEMALILKKYIDSQNMSLRDATPISYRDKDNIADWAKEAVAFVSRKGILRGNGKGEFIPKGTLTRAEAAQVIYMLDQMR